MEYLAHKKLACISKATASMLQQMLYAGEFENTALFLQNFRPTVTKMDLFKNTLTSNRSLKFLKFHFKISQTSLIS